MEIVSSKLSLSATNTPQGSLRSLERKETFSHPKRWNATAQPPQQRSSHRRRESLTSGGSLMSLKAYYRKLRTFKGTIKALISFRRLPMVVPPRTASLSAAAAVLPQHVEAAEAPFVESSDPPKMAEAVVKLADDATALQTVQSQVKELVEKGHVVTELGSANKDDVTYRMQGNLDHYTEDNLRKRVKLQEHPHMVALTQRLWLSAVHAEEDRLSYGAYEAYMLRLHRLILPEFDLAQSKQLIQDDWARDTDGKDALDYRFFHFSMYELVDLWTDTVDAEDYISLLYCIMHSLTFELNGRHVLKDLNDINPIDIMEAAKDVTMDEIERDLAHEMDSETAQMYRDRITSEDDASEDDAVAITEGCEDAALEEDTTDASEVVVPPVDGGDAAVRVHGESNSSTQEEAVKEVPVTRKGLTSSTHEDAVKHVPLTRKASRGVSASASGPPSPRASSTSPRARATSAAKTSPSQASQVSQARKSSKEGIHANATAPIRPPPIQTTGDATDDLVHIKGTHGGDASDVALATGSFPPDVETHGSTPGSSASDETHGSTHGSTASDGADSDAATEPHTRVASQSNSQGVTTRGAARTSVANAGPRASVSPTATNQYASGPNGEISSMSVLSLGSGHEHNATALKPTTNRKPSALASGHSPRHHSGHPTVGSSDQRIWGQGLGSGQASSPPGQHTHMSAQANDAMSPTSSSSSPHNLPGYPTTGSSTFVSPRSSLPPRVYAKDNEIRPGYLLIGGDESSHGASSRVVNQGHLSPRARSVTSSARRSTSSHTPVPTYLLVGNSNERPSVVGSNGTPFSALSLDKQPSNAVSYDAGSLMVSGGLLSSSRMSMNYNAGRPATSSLPSPRATVIGAGSGLDGFLHAKAYYQETPASPTRPPSRATRGYSQQYASPTLDGGGFGVQVQSLSSPRHSPQHRSTFIHYASPQQPHQEMQRAFVGAVVGASSLVGDGGPTPSLVTPRMSIAKGAQRSTRVGQDRQLMALDLGLAGASARLSVPKDSAATISPRPAATASRSGGAVAATAAAGTAKWSDTGR